MIINGLLELRCLLPVLVVILDAGRQKRNMEKTNENQVNERDVIEDEIEEKLSSSPYTYLRKLLLEGPENKEEVKATIR